MNNQSDSKMTNQKSRRPDSRVFTLGCGALPATACGGGDSGPGLAGIDDGGVRSPIVSSAVVTAYCSVVARGVTYTAVIAVFPRTPEG
jgi:hypothetical protein